MSTVTEAQDRVTAAREALKAAEAEYQAAVNDSRRIRITQDLATVLAAHYADFLQPGYDRDTFVAPWDKTDRMNPLDPETCQFGAGWLAGSTTYVYRRDDQERTRPTRCAVSSGQHVGSLGQKTTLRNDQTGAKMGDYEVVGLVFYDADGSVARVVGEVPNLKLACASFK